MTLEELGSLGEFISSFAVVASLIYVALQVKQNARDSRIATRQSVLEASRNMMGEFSTREHLETAVKAAKEGYAALSEIERIQYSLMNRAQLRNIEDAFLLKTEGVLDEEVFVTFERRARQIVREFPEITDHYGGTTAFAAWLANVREDEAAR